MTAFAQHFAFEFKTGLRNPNLFFINYLFPLGFYAMMGLVMTQINPGFTETMVPAMVVFAIMASTILGLPSPLVESREAGIYRSFKINGVPALSILAIPVMTTIFHVLITSTLIVLTGPALFKGIAPVHWGSFALVALVTAFACGAIGALIGVISANSQATVLWSQLIFLPSMLIGGLMLPLSLLPKAILPFSALLPTSHAMQAFLGLAYDQPTTLNPFVSLGVLLAGGALAFGLAIYLFNWDSRNQTRQGHPLMALLALAPFVVSIFLK
ncbi:MAG: ABC transporter permease [Chloroflexi bacterium]|nr:ABC transporter permease [Chloroflexota bacterium]